jgi:PLP dependent protein
MSDNSLPLPTALARVLQRIADCKKQYARAPGSVQLIAVSKTQPAERVRSAWACGQQHFGENYLQEALEKQHALRDCNLTWHFIGPIQSNKTREIAEHFDWVHSVDRLKIAQRLHDQRPEGRRPLQVLLQVNLSGESSKAGVGLHDVEALAAQVEALSNLRLCGLMAIPAPTQDVAVQRQVFKQLADARARLEALGHRHCRELSMGMSADFAAAIAEGATMVRIGSDIFGRRG